MNDTFVYLVYTHEEYNDVLDIHLKRLRKFLPDVPVSLCSNNIDLVRNTYSDFPFKNLYKYDDTQLYGERLRKVLSQMTEEYVLFNHEHNILVNDVDKEVLPRLVHEMKLHGMDQVRMFVTGILSPSFPDGLNLVRNTGDYFISCATTLWRRTVFLDIATQFHTHSFRCFECEPIQQYASQFKNYYLSSSKDMRFVDEGHFLSYHFPVAHLTGNGKWRTNTPTNRFFIQEIQDEYGVDLNKRGRI